MILSVSRRTDIPCCYAGWFMNRVRAGYALTRNPRSPAQLYRVPITPAVVDCIVFWTKDPAPLMPYLDELEGMGYSCCFQFTLTPYGRELEPGLRRKENILDTFLALRPCLKNDKTPAARPFYRHAAPIFLAICQDSRGKSACLAAKAAAHPSFRH